MLRFVCRALGYLGLAAAFVAAVVDGTRSIASGALLLSRAGDPWSALDPGLAARIAGSVPGWAARAAQDWGAIRLAELPLVPVLVVLAALLLWLAQRREPEVGYLTR